MTLAYAWALHLAAVRPYEEPRDSRLAYPFGTPHGMPPHYWRVSGDMMQALCDASPPSFGPNPKTSFAEIRKLFGWPVLVDPDAPPGTLTLEPVP